MNSLTKSVSATLYFDAAGAPEFWPLSGPVCWCLGQAEIAIQSMDLAIGGETMTIETAQGVVTLTRRAEPDQTCIGVAVETGPQVDPIVAQQLCYQITRRLGARYPARNIEWVPGKQMLCPASFTWGVLRNMPSRLGDIGRARCMPHYGATPN